MRLHYDLPEYMRAYQVQGGVLFDFEAEEITVFLSNRVAQLKKALSTHKQMAREQQKTIDRLSSIFDSLQQKLQAQQSESLSLEEAISDPTNVWTIFQEVVRNGLWLYACPRCDEIYEVSSCWIDNWITDGDGRETVQCPKDHDIFYLSQRMGVFGEPWDKSTAGTYKISKRNPPPTSFNYYGL